MQSESIRRLRAAVDGIYGSGAVSLYGSSEDEEHGTAFTLAGIPATFSVYTRDGALADGEYDVQIESVPPGDYLYTDVVTLERFLELVARVVGPPDQWPIRVE
jgi:hypothetical protein